MQSTSYSRTSCSWNTISTISNVPRLGSVSWFFSPLHHKASRPNQTWDSSSPLTEKCWPLNIEILLLSFLGKVHTFPLATKRGSPFASCPVCNFLIRVCKLNRAANIGNHLDDLIIKYRERTFTGATPEGNCPSQAATQWTLSPSFNNHFFDSFLTHFFEADTVNLVLLL